MFQVTQSRGRRFSSADAFLRPALKRPNLVLATRATVLGVELEGTRAVGVRVRTGRRRSEVLRADREVILSAGAIGSPQLLQVSGIGDPGRRTARAVGMDVRHALPGVGGNLQDHPFVTVIWEVSDTDTLLVAEQPRFLAEWLLRRSGPLTSTVAEVVAFHRTRGGLPAADIQFHMGAAYYEDHGAETLDGHAMVIAPVLVRRRRVAGCGCARQIRPTSRGFSPTPCRSPRTWPRWSPESSWRARSPASRRRPRSSPRS